MGRIHPNRDEISDYCRVSRSFLTERQATGSGHGQPRTGQASSAAPAPRSSLIIASANSPVRRPANSAGVMRSASNSSTAAMPRATARPAAAPRAVNASSTRVGSPESGTRCRYCAVRYQVHPEVGEFAGLKALFVGLLPVALVNPGAPTCRPVGPSERSRHPARPACPRPSPRGWSSRPAPTARRPARPPDRLPPGTAGWTWNRHRGRHAARPGSRSRHLPRRNARGCLTWPAVARRSTGVDPARRRRSRYRGCIGDDDNAAGRRRGRAAVGQFAT